MKGILRLGLVSILLCSILLGIAATNAVGEFNPSSADPAPLRHQIREILKDSHFAYLNPWIWVTRIIQSIKDFFNLFPTLQTGPSPGLVIVLKWLAILIATTIPYWLFRYGRRWLRREIRVKQVQAPLPSQPVSAESLEMQATDYAREHEFREAVRLIYLACLTRFKEQGLLPQTATSPDRENLATIKVVWGRQHPAGIAFAGLIRLFQEKWYGLKSCELPDYQQSMELAQLIRAQLKDAHR